MSSFSGKSLHCCGHDLLRPHLFSVEAVGMVRIVNSPKNDSDTSLCLHNNFIIQVPFFFSHFFDLQTFPQFLEGHLLNADCQLIVTECSLVLLTFMHYLKYELRKTVQKCFAIFFIFANDLQTSQLSSNTNRKHLNSLISVLLEMGPLKRHLYRVVFLL